MHVLRYFHQPPKATTNTVVVNNTAILTVSAALNNKVDKSAGRGLSQNNYSTPEKNKLGGVEEGAEVNVLADWNELNIESDAYILNKPESLPASDVYEWAKLPTKPSYTPTEIGLGNVTNDAQVKRSEMGVANGVATLNQDGLIPAIQLPSYVDDVLEYSSASLFPRPGTDGKIYVDTTTNLTYRWSGSDYVEISKSLALGETSSTAYRGDRGKTAYTHATDSSRLTTATSVGLYKVGCTAQGHISGLTAITKADITGLGIPAQDTNTTYSFAGGTNKFTVTPSGGTAQDVTVTPSISAATQSAAGLMSAADKKKLDGIAAGAQVNSVTGVKGNSESSYRTGNVNITATNIGLSNVANLDLSKAIKSITRSGTTFTYTCLDGTTGTFTLLDNNTTYSAGTGLSLNNTTFSLALTKKLVTDALGYTPPTTDTNTTYSAGSGLSLSGTTFSLALTKALVTTALGYTPPTSDTNTWRTVLCNGTSIGNNTLNLKAGTNVTLSNSDGTITISSTDTNTWPSKVSLLTNDTGFITGITKAMVTNALGYTPPTSDTDTWRTIQCNGTSIGSNTLNIKAGTNVTLSNSNGTITISSTDTNTWPSKVSQLTNDSGFITGITKAMVTTALGYTPPTTDTNTWRGIQNNLTSNSTTDSLSAYLGYLLANGSARDSTKLPLSGGTLSNSNFGAQLTIERSGSTNMAAIGFKNSHGVLGYLATNTVDGAFVRYNAAASALYTILDSSNSSVSKSGETLTVKINGTSQSLTNTNTTYSAGTGLSLSGTTFSLNLTKTLVTNALGYTPPASDTNTHRPILVNGTLILGDNTTALNLKAGNNVSLSNSSGTVTIAATDTTYSNFVKSGSGAKAGLVPAPSTTAGTTHYLREDGSWAVPTDTKYPSVTLWGQTFDHSNNVTGTITIGAGDIVLNNNRCIYAKDSAATTREILRLSSGNALLLGYGSCTAGYSTYVDGNEVYIRTGASRLNTIVSSTTATLMYRTVLINNSSGTGRFVFYPDKQGTVDPNLRMYADIIMEEGQLLEMKNGSGTAVILLDGVDGEIRCVSLTQTSDRLLKENITDIPKDALDNVSKVSLKKFNFKGDDKTRYGVIALDLLEVGLDSLVTTNKDGILSVDYTLLLILKIELLTNQVQTLEDKIRELETNNKNNV